ncbi:DUF1768-domain-containing protein, partial [Crucibulum laeve]
PAPISPSAEGAIRFDQNDMRYIGFMNHSPHRVMYLNKTYPTATHLFEALKFLEGHPRIAEEIRTVQDVHQVYPKSARYQQYERRDWGMVFLQMMERAIVHKFKQHPDLRSLLLETGNLALLYMDTADAYWGMGPDGETGENQLGKLLMKVRDQLKEE